MHKHPTEIILGVAFSYLKRNNKGFHIGSEVLPHIER